MMNSIPLELLHEIFSRLPVKSIARCRCVSEQWRSILCSAEFTELFLTKSSTRPSLFFVMRRSRNNEFLFFSFPQLDSTEDDKSSVAACVQFEFWKDFPVELCGYASGLFLLRRVPISKEEKYTEHLICNPSTGQYEFLPTVKTGCVSSLGFDPIDKVFKVVSSNASYTSCADVYNIFTLGTREKKWRKVKSPLPHRPWSAGICINGALYYLAPGSYATRYIVCFDVRSEKFNFVHPGLPRVYTTTFVNYKGKLGVIRWTCRESMTIWVLEDAEKNDWSEHRFTLPGDIFSGTGSVNAVRVTATGEIVLMENYYQSKPFNVFYFHPERNTVKRHEVQGFENRGLIHPFVDHVDDLTLNMKSWQLHQHVARFENFNKLSALCFSPSWLKARAVFIYLWTLFKKILMV